MESNDVAMTFWEHLEELRRRIIISAIAIAVFTVLSLSFSKPIQKVIMFPLETSMNTLPKHCLLYTSPSPRDRTRSRMPSSA